MKLKFYLRGLGIGIVVTALLMGYANGRQKTASMTDEQIMARAEALGMVREDQVLLPVSGNAKEETPVDSAEPVAMADVKPSDGVAEDDANAEDASGAEPVDSSSTDDTAETKSADSPDAGNAAEVKTESTKVNNMEAETAGTETDAVGQREKPVSGNSGMTTLEIARGSGSATVSALLEKGGLVDSAEEFDRYLCEYNYDNKIVAGVHQIPKEADYETIAKIITTR